MSKETSPTDRRAIRTKKMIKKAVYELLDKKNFNDISITDITEQADINRGTFYLHYVDKFDLIEKLENEILEELMNFAKDTTFEDVFIFDERLNQVVINQPVPFIKKIFEFLQTNEILAKAFLGANADPKFRDRLKDFILHRLKDNSFITSVNINNFIVPSEYFISYIMSAHLGVVLQWVNSGMKESPDEMALILTRLFILGPFSVAGLKNDLNMTRK